jgi:hypothetical protein
MPSIVSFGKIFCRYFLGCKFRRDFGGFRPVRTLLLYSDRASARPICANSPRSYLVVLGFGGCPSSSPYGRQSVCGSPRKALLPASGVMRAPKRCRTPRGVSTSSRATHSPLGRARTRRSRLQSGRAADAPRVHRSSRPPPREPCACLAQVVRKPVAERLSNQRELCAVRQASHVAALAARQVVAAIATQHGDRMPSAVEPNGLRTPRILG